MKKYCALLLFVFFVLVGVEVYRFSQYNQSPLKIETYDGLDDPFHPSVKYFPEGWNGFKYWMAVTPYSPEGKPYRSANENPCIYVSNDGVHWTVPAEFKNPILELSEAGLANWDHYSDPHIVMKDGTMQIWCRYTEGRGDNESVRMVETVDGVHWSEEKVILRFSKSVGNRTGRFVSPSLLYEEGLYSLYGVRYIEPGEKTEGSGWITLCHSGNGLDWTPEKRIVLHGRAACPWHIDVQHIDGKYWLVVYDKGKGEGITLWQSSDGVNFSFVREVLRSPRVRGSFYKMNLYRACLQKIGEKYHLYFTATTELDSFIGLMLGDDPSSLEVVSPDGTDWGIKEYFFQQYRMMIWLVKFKLMPFFGS